MDIPYSRCGKDEMHDAHEFGSGFSGIQCLGFTIEDQISRRLLTTAGKYMLEHYGSGARKLPAGLRMEMHPVVLRALQLSVTKWGVPGLIQDRLFDMPMKVNRDLPASGWRIVVVTESVLLKGGYE
ncbi:MAG: hypothetical protein JWM19_956 [Actinomycetia bacterium]|nr:hypothetical protein [Actinomycetes bacterium]